MTALPIQTTQPLAELLAGGTNRAAATDRRRERVGDATKSRSTVIAAPLGMNDYARLTTFQRECESILRRRGSHLHVDLSALIAADSKLVAVLIWLVREARSRGSSIDFMLSPAIDTWVEVLGVAEVLERGRVDGDRVPK